MTTPDNTGDSHLDSYPVHHLAVSMMCTKYAMLGCRCFWLNQTSDKSRRPAVSVF